MSEPHHQSIPAGTTDFLLDEMRTRKRVEGILSNVFEMFGYSPQQTPILEHREVFTGHHGAGEALLFQLEDKKGVPLVLRYDLTVPLARVVQKLDRDIPRPYKRYQIGQVFRDDTIDKGHYREFTQCDADIVGSNSYTADAETILVAHHGLTALGVNEFTLRVGHRKILLGIAELIGLNSKEAITVLCRAIDSADKITKDGTEGIANGLRSNGIKAENIDLISQLVSTAGSPRHVLPLLRQSITNQSGTTGIDNLADILSVIPEEVLRKIQIDVSLARGADYYTGFILEGVIEGINVGAVLGGGRYDNLTHALGGNSEPAVGMAFGLDRILIALRELDIDRQEETVKFLLVPLRENDHIHLTEHAQTLRDKGLRCDYYHGDPNPDAIIRYATTYNFQKIVTYHATGGYFHTSDTRLHPLTSERFT